MAVDRGGTTEELTRFLSQAVESYGGKASDVELRLPHAGTKMRGKRIVALSSVKDRPSAGIEVYAAVVGPDLFVVAIGVLEPSETNQKLRAILIKSTDAAVLKRPR